MTLSGGIIVTSGSRAPLPYLAAQACCAGFAVALLFALGNTTFILANGAEKLPYAYLWTCLLLPPLSLAHNRLQRQWSVSRLNFATLALFATLHGVAWLFAQSTRLDIAGYVLVIGYTLILAFLVIAVITQANRLFDTEQMKTLLPFMLAAQTAALIVCGIVVAPLSRWLGGEVQTLFVGIAALLLMSVFQALTVRRFPELALPPHHDDIKPLRIEELLLQSLPRLLLLYKFLASTASLLIMYLLTVMAQRVISSSTDMTRFFGYLIAAATTGALLFLLFGAGRLLLARGVGFGLLLNPVGVLGLVAVMLICSVVLPHYALLLLGFAAAGRALDFILSVGTTETSVNTYVKRLPENTQLSLINAVNAQAYPLSYGITAAIVLLLQGGIGSSLCSLLVATLLVCSAWTAVAFFLAANYDASS